MKNLLLVIAILLTGSVKAQFLKNFDSYYAHMSILRGVGIEGGKRATFEPFKKLGYAYGVDAAFAKSAVDGKLDVNVYAKGLWAFHDNFHAVAQIGVRDLVHPGFGLGARYTELGKKMNFIAEPMFHTDGFRLNLGLQVKLK